MSTLKKALICSSFIVVGLSLLGWWKMGASWTPRSGLATPEDHFESTNPSDTLDSILIRVKTTTDRSAKLQSLHDLRSLLQSLPKEEATALIQKLLASGEDQMTDLSFELGAGGAFVTWPSFRTFLLDTLFVVDPVASASTSRQILSSPTTADEWAVALRNVGRVETTPEANAYLIERTQALIANPTWQSDPSIGYLNAFDVLVHTKATETIPLLSSLIQRKERKDLAHAGFLTLDRLVQKDPVAVLTHLSADPNLAASRPEMTAQEFARVDFRDPAQRAIVSRWLLDPSRTANELRSFANVYPNNNHFVSNNLLTTESPHSGSDLAAHDREALEILRAWSTDSAFQPIAVHLRTMITRLDGFVHTQSSASPAR